MNASLQAKVRHILIREFYRRGGLTWDMKLALQCIRAGRPVRGFPTTGL